MKNPVETKVVATVGTTASIGGAVSLLFGLAANYHWFTPPPPYLTALGVTVLSGLLSAGAGWLAPHTSRTPPVITGIIRDTAGELTFAPAAEPPLTAAEVEAIKNRLNAPLTPPAAAPQPEGTKP